MDPLHKDLNFLILYYLRANAKDHPEVVDTLETHFIQQDALPTRVDWEGQAHPLSFDELAERYGHITPDHLPTLLQILNDLCNKSAPIPMQGRTLVQGEASLLPLAKQSVVKLPPKTLQLKANLDDNKAKKGRNDAMDVEAKAHDESIYKQASSTKTISTLQRLYAGSSSHKLPASVVSALNARQYGKTVSTLKTTPIFSYSKIEMLKQIRGHNLPLFRVIFDRSGTRIITGADDYLVKLWSATTGLLLQTVRGHSCDITDAAVDYSNKYLASTAADASIRLWHLNTCAPAAILLGHAESVNYVAFCPMPGATKLLSMSPSDGMLRLWTLTPKADDPECFDSTGEIGELKAPAGGNGAISWSSGGTFIAVGDKEGQIHIWTSQPFARAYTMSEHREAVALVVWSHRGFRLCSAGKDGWIRIWEYQPTVTFQAPSYFACVVAIAPLKEAGRAVKGKAKGLVWTANDELVVVAGNMVSSTLQVFETKTGQLVWTLKGHTEPIHVLEAHPTDWRIIASSGDDGKVIFWNLETGVAIKEFTFGQDVQANDGRFSPNGDLFVVSDGQGYVTLFGFGDKENYSDAPTEQFFKHDFTPYIRDANNFIVDETTHMPPHLMPRGDYCNSLMQPYEVQPKDPPALGAPGGFDEFDLANDTRHRQALVDFEAQLLSGQVPPTFTLPTNSKPAGPNKNTRRQLRKRKTEYFFANERAAPAMTPQEWDAYRDILDDAERGTRRRQGGQPSNAAGIRGSLRSASRSQVFIEDGGEITLLDQENTAPPTRRLRRLRSQSQADGLTEADLNDEDANDEFKFSGDDASSSSGMEDLLAELGTESSESERSDSDGDFDAGGKKPKKPRKPKAPRPVGRPGSRKTPRKRAVFDSDDEPELEPDDEMEDEEHSAYWIEEDLVKKTKRTRDQSGLSYPTWLTATRPQFTYAPQVGDRVVFWRVGHEAYARVEELAQADPIPDSVPQVAFCLIKNITYVSLPFIHAVIQLKLVSPQPPIAPFQSESGVIHFPQDPEGGEEAASVEFCVHYSKQPGTPEFLVLANRVEKALETQWPIGRTFWAWYDGEGPTDGQWYSGLVQDYSPAITNDLKSQPGVASTATTGSDAMDVDGAPHVSSAKDLWECLQVVWNQSSETTFVSPWEVEDMTEEGGLKPIVIDAFTPEATKELMAAILDTCKRLGRSVINLFMQPVSLAAYPTYLAKVAYPIDLKTIWARIDNFFYRHVSQLEYDISRILDNSEAFNGVEGEVTENARLVTASLLATVHSLADRLVPESRPRKLPRGQNPTLAAEARRAEAANHPQTKPKHRAIEEEENLSDDDEEIDIEDEDSEDAPRRRSRRAARGSRFGHVPVRRSERTRSVPIRSNFVDPDDIDLRELDRTPRRSTRNSSSNGGTASGSGGFSRYPSRSTSSTGAVAPATTTTTTNTSSSLPHVQRGTGLRVTLRNPQPQATTTTTKSAEVAEYIPDNPPTPSVAPVPTKRATRMRSNLSAKAAPPKGSDDEYDDDVVEEEPDNDDDSEFSDDVPRRGRNPPAPRRASKRKRTKPNSTIGGSYGSDDNYGEDGDDEVRPPRPKRRATRKTYAEDSDDDYE